MGFLLPLHACCCTTTCLPPPQACFALHIVRCCAAVTFVSTDQAAIVRRYRQQLSAASTNSFYGGSSGAGAMPLLPSELQRIGWTPTNGRVLADLSYMPLVQASAAQQAVVVHPLRLQRACMSRRLASVLLVQVAVLSLHCAHPSSLLVSLRVLSPSKAPAALTPWSHLCSSCHCLLLLHPLLCLFHCSTFWLQCSPRFWRCCCWRRSRCWRACSWRRYLSFLLQIVQWALMGILQLLLTATFTMFAGMKVIMQRRWRRRSMEGQGWVGISGEGHQLPSCECAVCNHIHSLSHSREYAHPSIHAHLVCNDMRCFPAACARAQPS